MSGWFGQRRGRAGPILFWARRRSRTLGHILDEVSRVRLGAWPKMYMPCLARDRSTLMRLGFLRKPILPLGWLRTSEIMMTSLSSP